MNKFNFRLASAVFGIAALWGSSAVHAQDVHAEQAVPKADSPEAARAAENPLLGTWRLQSFVYEVIGTGTRFKPFGEHPIGFLSYSPDGRMYVILVAEDRPKPHDVVPTDEEKVNLEGSMVAYAGTYTVDREKVVHHVDVSWNEYWTGTDQVRFYKIDGDTLTITTAPGPSPLTAGVERRAILVWKKVQ
jgi:Lipocalin-like domain